MAFCAHCKDEFPDPVWPNARGIYCSKKCNQRAWARRHAEEIRERNKFYVENNHSKVLETKIKYNNSEKGKEANRRYRVRNMISQTYLERYRTDPEVRRIQRSREISRKKLFKHTQGNVRCAVCHLEPPHKIQCHHIDQNPLNANLENLMWLCTKCHHDVHDCLK